MNSTSPPLCVAQRQASPLGAPWSFEALLEPVSIAEFCTRYFSAHPLHVKRDRPDFYRDLLDLGRLERYLSADEFFTRHSVTTPKQGYGWPDPPPANVGELYQRLLQGDSLRLRQMECFLDPTEPIITLFRQMVAGLGHPKESLSCYVSPADAVGLGPHFDETEIFTLQISGKKRWRIHHRVPGRASDVVDKATLDAPVHDFVLGPGDLLYLPHGYVHDVVSEGPSFSLTLVFSPVTWRSVLDLLVSRLASSPVFSEAMPAGVLLSDAAPEALRAGLASRVAVIQGELAALDAEGLADEVANRLVSGMTIPPSDQLKTVFALDSVGLQTQVRKRPGIPHHLNVTDTKAVLVLPGGFTLEASVKAAPAIRAVLASTSPMRVSELSPGLSDTAKVALVRKLIGCGLLEVVPEAST